MKLFAGRRRQSRPKVFGIGFHKTGTSSLAVALRHLDYRVTGPNFVYHEDIARDALDLALKLVPKFDAFQDNPWPILYRELDARFPGSRFVLTMRPTEKWIRSAVRHFGSTPTPMRKWIYGEGHGAPAGYEAIYVERYERHNREVEDYFRDRPDDLLVLRVTEGDGWEKLAPFLGIDIDVPTIPFPHANAGAGEGDSG